MIRALTALILALAALAALPAAAQNYSGASPAQLARELARIDAELRAINQALVNAGAIPPELGDLGSIEARLAELTRKVELLEAKLDAIANDATNRFYDLEIRVTELEGGDITLVPSEPLGSGASQPIGAAATTGPQVTAAERSELDAAINDVRAGRFDVAEQRLQTFTRNYPGSPLAGEAQYWLGEGFFIRGFYRDAARAYLDGYNRDQTGSFAAQNLLRLGVSFARLGQTQDACLTLREVRLRFPAASTSVLDEAASESARLGCG